MSALSLSVVVPAHDAPQNLARCLEALARSTVAHELIVVDDASTDPAAVETARQLAGEHGTVIELAQNGGPGLARNTGAEAASGDLLVFIDSDVVVAPTTLERLRDVLAADPTLAAVFGSYDARPASPGLVSEYRNLLHHWVHQNGPAEATTFWAGCGAVRREIFTRLGGFDAATYPQPSIEDIELGMRMTAAGERIRLDPAIQVTHLKHWTLAEMIRVDVTRRAIPWTRLLIDRPGTGTDLNLEPAQEACVALVFLTLASLIVGLAFPSLRAAGLWAWAPFVALAPVLWINRGLYRLFLAHRGPLFALTGVFLHLLYYFYGGAAHAWAHVTHSHRRRSQPTAV